MSATEIQAVSRADDKVPFPRMQTAMHVVERHHHFDRRSSLSGTARSDAALPSSIEAYALALRSISFAWRLMTPRAGMLFGRLGSHRFRELQALERRV
jgi:hypothetical protein